MWELEKIFLELLRDMEKRQKETVLDEVQLRDLVDLALLLGDKEWFMELTDRLNVIAS